MRVRTHVETAAGARIPSLGFGTGGARTGSADNVLAALRAGYRHIDTARKYGSERSVGEAIRASAIPRGEIFLTTKVSHEHLAADAFRESTGTSLAELGVDHVDLLLVHWPLPDMNLAATMEALADMQRSGRTRHIGVANFNVALLDEAVRLCPEPLSALQAEYHPYLDQSKLLAACRRHGIAFVAHCPLARGRVAADPVLADIAAGKGKTASQVALRWLLQQEGVAVIPSSGTAARIAENADLFDFELDEAEMRCIHALAAPDGRLVNPIGRAPLWD